MLLSCDFISFGEHKLIFVKLNFFLEESKIQEKYMSYIICLISVIYLLQEKYICPIFDSVCMYICIIYIYIYMYIY